MLYVQDNNYKGYYYLICMDWSDGPEKYVMQNQSWGGKAYFKGCNCQYKPPI